MFGYYIIDKRAWRGDHSTGSETGTIRDRRSPFAMELAGNAIIDLPPARQAVMAKAVCPPVPVNICDPNDSLERASMASPQQFPVRTGRQEA